MDIFAYSTFFLKYKGNQKGLCQNRRSLFFLYSVKYKAKP